MECVDFMQPRWPSRISTFNSIFCRSFRLIQGNPSGDIGRDSGSGKHSDRGRETKGQTSGNVPPDGGGAHEALREHLALSGLNQRRAQLYY